eukprot:Amastigsp_a339243_551.p3 type:complete len:116 gc:universal Amastigsp_a339243_551:435-782(+)
MHARAIDMMSFHAMPPQYAPSTVRSRRARGASSKVTQSRKMKEKVNGDVYAKSWRPSIGAASCERSMNAVRRAERIVAEIAKMNPRSENLSSPYDARVVPPTMRAMMTQSWAVAR